jgi:hypothetical protein
VSDSDTFDPRDLPKGIEHLLGAPPPGTVPRRSRRRPIPDVLVTIDAAGAEGGRFVVSALDINADGIGLTLPPELEPGTHVVLSFRHDPSTEFARVPAFVLHREGDSAGVRFSEWPESDRLRLLEYLVRCYEADEPGEKGARSG